MRKIIVGNDDHAGMHSGSEAERSVLKAVVKNRPVRYWTKKSFRIRILKLFLKQKKIIMEKTTIIKESICGVFWQLPLILHREKEG